MKAKHIVVTGGSNGLGRHVVLRLASKGANVTVIGRNLADDHFSKNIRLIRCDDVGSVKCWRQLDLSEVGNVDAWINNAAYSGGFSKFDDTDLDECNKILSSTFSSALFGTKNAIKAMTEQSTQGHIFNITGAGGNHWPTPNFAVYGASKSGVVQFTKTIANELKKDLPLINFHIVSPGLMKTPLLMQGLPPIVAGMMGILAKEPDVVGTWLADKILDIVDHNYDKLYHHMPMFYDKTSTDKYK